MRRLSFETPAFASLSAGSSRMRQKQSGAASCCCKLLVPASAESAAVAGIIASWILTIPATVPASALGARTADLANGRTMFLAGGCAACHATPGQDDRTRLGGGLAIKTAFGTFYAPNISSDAKDGIGGWSEADFVTALTKGTSPTGEHYFPVFPYPSYQNMRLDDVRDLFAYLKTLPAVCRPPCAMITRCAFPFGVRRVIGGWRSSLFLAARGFRTRIRRNRRLGAARRLSRQRARPPAPSATARAMCSAA